MSATKAPARYLWIAERDGTAHAQLRGALRTVCDLRALDLRFAWPKTRYCPDCTATVVPPSHMSEPELIAAYGGLPEAPID